MKNYRVVFQVKGTNGSKLGRLEQLMESELIRVYNIYVDRGNSGVTDRLTDEFENLYPNYFEDNRDKEWYDLAEYNKYMADGYQRLIIDNFNTIEKSPILDFYVDPEELVFTGRLKWNRNISIDFYLKEVEEN